MWNIITNWNIFLFREFISSIFQTINIRKCEIYAPTKTYFVLTGGIFVSIGENKVLKMYKDDPNTLNRLSQHMLVRTYPAGTRTDSSNYNPTQCWNAGCQVGEFKQRIRSRFVPHRRFDSCLSQTKYFKMNW